MNSLKDKLGKGLDKVSKEAKSVRDKMSKGVDFFEERLGKASDSAKERIDKLKDQAVNKVFELNGKRYKGKKLIGEGGFGYVYLVQEEHRGTTYALKQLIISSKEQLEQAKNELSVWKSIPNHRNIVRLEDGGVLKNSKGDTEVLLLMEYCSGGGVLDLMNQRFAVGQKLSEREIWNIFADVCEAVYVMHNRDVPIAHRDIKVENVLIQESTYKVCDFGSATTKIYQFDSERERGIAEEDISKNTTLEYRSPEMVDLYSKKPITEKVDIWALGVMLYKLAFFQAPFTEKLGILNESYFLPEDSKYSDNVTTMIKILLNGDPAKRPDIFTVVRQVDKIRGTTTERKPQVTRRQSVSSSAELPSVRQSTDSINLPVKQSISASASTSTSNAPKMKLFDMVDWQSDQGPSTAPTHIRKPSSENTPTSYPPQLPRSPSFGTMNQQPSSNQQQQPSNLRRSNNSMYSSGAFTTTTTISTPSPTPAIDTSFFDDSGFAAFNSQQVPNQQFNIPPTSITPPLPSVSPTPYNIPSSVTPPPSTPSPEPAQASLQSAVDEQMKQLRLNDSTGEVQNWPTESSNANSASRPKITRRESFSKSISKLEQKLKSVFSKKKKQTEETEKPKEKDELPNNKQMRKIVFESWSSDVAVRKEAAKFFEYIKSKSTTKDPAKCLKVLVFTHKTFQHGSPFMIGEAFQIARYFENLRDQWNQTRMNAEKSSDLEYAGLIAQYTTFLVKKIQFHHAHREFEGSLSLDTYAAALKTKNVQIKIGEGLISKDTAKELFNFQKIVLTVPSFIFTEPLDEIKLTVVPPLIEEAFSIYATITFILSKLSGSTDLSEFKGVYGVMFNHLNQFFSKAKVALEKIGNDFTFPEIPQSVPDLSSSLSIRLPESYNPYLSVEKPMENVQAPPSIVNTPPSQSGKPPPPSPLNAPILQTSPQMPRPTYQQPTPQYPQYQQQYQQQQQYMQPQVYQQPQFSQNSPNFNNNQFPWDQPQQQPTFQQSQPLFNPQPQQQPIPSPQASPKIGVAPISSTTQSKTSEDKLKNVSQNTKNLEILNQLLNLPENRFCADCGKRDPNWASINLGVFLCMSCAGIHRSLGTHITKVKSVTLDTWEPEWIETMSSIGNARAKAIWEANVPSNYQRPKETDPQSVIKKWIVAKYEDKEFKGTPAVQPTRVPSREVAYNNPSGVNDMD